MNDATGRWDRIETHEAILPSGQLITGLLTNEAVAPFSRTWTVKERFDRGSLRAVLEAPDRETTDRLLDEYVRTRLPAVPLTQMCGNLPRFWLELAKANSSPRQSLWSKGQPLPKRHDIECAIEICVAADLIFELPNLYEEQESVQGPILYFRDCGLLRHFLDILALIQLATMPKDVSNIEAFRLRERISDRRSRAEDFRWKGFVIDALRVMLNGRASAHYWRREDNEIDLVLEVQNGERWGVEITYGNPNNKPAYGFFRAEKDLNLSRRSVIAEHSAGPVRGGVECLDLPRALHEVQRWLS